MRPSFWPQSLFGRLIGALVIAVVLAQAATLYLFARHLERFVLDSSVREWSRRITEITLLLEQLPLDQRAPTVARLKWQAARLAAHHARPGLRLRGHILRGGMYLLPPIDAGAHPAAVPKHDGAGGARPPPPDRM